MLRCEHGLLRGLCVVRDCDHFDGATTPAAKTRTLRRAKGHGEVSTNPGTFRCTRCLQVKPLSDFYLNRNMKRGHQSRCKLCDNATRVSRKHA